MDDHADPRTDLQIPIVFHGDRVEGEGVIRNVSSSGALILDPTAPVTNGQKLTLELGIASELESLSLAAEVVRQVEDGFAVCFLFDTPEESTLALRLLDLLLSSREVQADNTALREEELAEPPSRSGEMQKQRVTGSALPNSVAHQQDPPRSERKEPTLSHFKSAIRATYGCGSELRERSPVRQVLANGSVWEGEVFVLDLINHATAATCYAWAVDGEVRAVLHEGQVTSPQKAVQISKGPRSKE